MPNSLSCLFHKSFILFVLLLLSACGGGGSSNGGGEDVDTEPTIRSVQVIGDSIANGFGVADPWPPRLASILGVEVFNTANSGEQTPFGLSVIEGLLDQNNPSHLVIMLGTNDALRGSVSNAISNLQAMVDIADGRNVIVIVATLPPITSSSSADSRAAQISNGIRNLNGAVIAEVRGAFGNGAGLLVDGIHPNNTGQQLIADTVAEVF